MRSATDAPNDFQPLPTRVAATPTASKTVRTERRPRGEKPVGAATNKAASKVKRGGRCAKPQRKAAVVGPGCVQEEVEDAD
eukprot:4491982-Prymnesium_polylepis.1